MPTKRNWLRISLRGFLVVFTCAVIGFAWCAHYANKRWAAFSAIRQAGGKIQMGMGEPSRLERWFGSELFGTVNKVDLRKGKVDNDLVPHIAALRELGRLDLSNAAIDDDGVRQLVHLQLSELWLQGTNIIDASAASISQIKSLDFLALNATSLSDSFLKQLDPLPNLESLGLRGTEVTGVGMQFLSRHPRLRELDVYSTKVDDAGVEHLLECRSLAEIGLSSTNVTDTVFEHLGKMPNLTTADLNASPVTTESVLAFEKSHPKCDIEWYRK